MEDKFGMAVLCLVDFHSNVSSGYSSTIPTSTPLLLLKCQPHFHQILSPENVGLSQNQNF